MIAMKLPRIIQCAPSFAVADTIAIENNVIYSPCIATEVGGKEEKQVNSEI